MSTKWYRVEIAVLRPFGGIHYFNLFGSKSKAVRDKFVADWKENYDGINPVIFRLSGGRYKMKSERWVPDIEVQDAPSIEHVMAEAMIEGFDLPVVKEELVPVQLAPKPAAVAVMDKPAPPPIVVDVPVVLAAKPVKRARKK